MRASRELPGRRSSEAAYALELLQSEGQLSIACVDKVLGPMRQTWFYCGGWTPQCWSSTLKVEDDRLFARRGRQYSEVLPTDIVEVKEFGFNNPFLLVTTADGRFHVGALTGQYDEVVSVLERYVGSGFCRSFVPSSGLAE